MLGRSLIAVSILAASAPMAMAGDAVGEWARVDGKGHVRFTPCGAALCGAITWLKDMSGPAKIGQRVFFDMKPSGENIWTGTAFNPEDGKEYSGKMTMNGASLTTAGCVFGGLICKTVEWTRAR